MENRQLIDDLCQEFEQRWQANKPPLIDAFLDQASDVERPALLKQLLEIELEYLGKRGTNPRSEDYERRFPQDIGEIHGAFAEARRRFPDVFEETASIGPTATVFPDSQSEPPPADVTASVDHYDPMIETQTGPSVVVPPELMATPQKTSVETPSSAPTMIGRYRIEKVLGQGSFGTVYLGFDVDLERNVAIKVPHPHRMKSPEAVKAFRDEGRVLASLDHPNILPVYDVGLTDNGICYVVSKYVFESTDLKTFFVQNQLSFAETTDIIAKIADGLNYAHTRGLVHRDIKPDNILLDQDRVPYVVDFGLALHEDEQSRRAGEVCGTPAYMSPEQFRGESHHLDGRSDLWSLGVVLYEFIAGRRPFDATTPSLMRDEVLTKEPKPPRQIDPLVPKQLEQVALKCLSKDLTQRYATASDVARDLRAVFREKLWYQRHILAVAAAAVLLIGTIVFWLVSGGSSAPTGGPSDEQQARIDHALGALQGMLADKEKLAFDPGRDLNLTSPISVDEIEWPQNVHGLRDQIAAAKAAENKDLERSLLFKASQALVSLGQFEGAEAVCLRMRDLTKDSPVSHAFSLVELGLAQAKNRKQASAIQSYRECIDIFEEFHRRIPNEAVIAKNLGTAYLRIGNAYKDTGHLDQAGDAYEKAKRLYEQHNLKSSLSTLLGNYGNLQSHREKLDEAVALHRQSGELAKELQDAEGQTTALVNLGNAYHRADRTADALKCYREAHARMTNESSYELKTILLLKLTMVLLKTGEVTEAGERLKQLAEIASSEDSFTQGAIRSLQSALDADAV